MTTSMYSVPFRDGQLKLEQLDGCDNGRFAVYYTDAINKKPLFSFILTVLNTAYHEDESLAFSEKVGAEEGEVVYQMHFDDHVDRKKLPYGIIALIKSSLYTVEEPRTVLKDPSFVNTEEFLAAFKDRIFIYLRERFIMAPANTPLYFAYYGLSKTEEPAKKDEAELEDALMKTFAKSGNFGVFRCVHGICSDENSYLAIAGETKDPRLTKKVLGSIIRNIKRRPKIHSDIDAESN